MSYTSDGRQSLINVTFHVGNVGFHQRNFNLLRFLASPPINSLQPRTYRSYEIFTSVKMTFWLCSIRVGGLPDSLFPIEAIFFSIDVLRAIHRRMISNFRDDAQILTVNNVKKLCAAKTKFDEGTVSNELANFRRLLALSYKNTIVGIKSPSPSPSPSPFIKCVKLYRTL